MATQVEKTLFPAPQGLGKASTAQPAVEIEIADDNAEPGLQDDGSMIVDLSGGKGKKSPDETEFGANLAEKLDDEEMRALVSQLDFDIDNDKRARADWESTYKEALPLLGLKIEQRTEPWDGACGVVHPMITEAVVRFQAETTTETFPASGPVRSKILGLETPKKKESAARVEADMNNLLTEEMPEFRPEHERMLFELPATGCAFKKVYYDKAAERPVSMFVNAEDVLLPYGVTNLNCSPRVTHVLRRTKDELIRAMESGFYREVDLDDNPTNKDDIKEAKDKETGLTSINDERFILHESHCDLYIEGDDKRKKDSKCAHPYVVTYIKGSTTEVLSIRRNWKEKDKTYAKRQHFVQYDYVPGFGAYGYGLFHLIGGYAKGATAILRQLVDAGTLANLPGGLKTRGMRIKGDDTPIAPGEWRDVDVGSGTISDNIMPLPYGEPSTTLAAILDKLIEDARRFAATADMQISDMSAQAPVGTTLALLERQLKVLTAVQARVHYSLKLELKLLKEIVSDYMPGEYAYEPETGKKSDKRADYASVEVIPVSDPNAATLSQRVVQYQAAIQMAQMAPEIYDLPQLHRDMLETLGFKNAGKIVPLADDLKPVDPVTENMAILMSKPVKAFLYQDHMAHLQVHQSAMQDPMIMQMMGQNPKAPMIMAAATAHIAEHMAYQYRQQIEGQLGMTLPPMEENLPPQLEAAISGMMAQAAQQVLQQNQALAAQMAQQQAMQDPALMLQAEELKVKKMAEETKRMKAQGDLVAKADDIRIKEKQVDGDLQLRGAQLGVDIQHNQAQVAGQNMQAGMKMGLDINKQRHEAAMQEKEHQHNVETSLRDQQHQHQMAERQQSHQENMDHHMAAQGQAQFAHQQTMDGKNHQMAQDKMRGDFSAKAHSTLTNDSFQRDKMGNDSQLQREQGAQNATLQREKNQQDAQLQRESGAQTAQLGREKLKSSEKMAAAKAAQPKPAAKKPAAKKKPK